jgi:Dimethlysulfonioproprionate lyase
MGAPQIIRTLIIEAEAYLRGLPPQSGLQAVCNGIARWGAAPPNDAPGAKGPACGFLDEALDAVKDAPGLKQAIIAAGPFLRWITYDLYPPAEIGPRFPRAHAFASLIGGAGLIHADDFELGLFLIAPRTLYRDHRHPAPELYAPLTGPHRWRFGIDAPWIEKPAHVPVWNEPMAVHATLVGEVPFLCLFGWTRDVNLPASVVPAKDWPQIEAAL